MRSHRRIFLTGLAIVALPAAMPSLAAGSSLLSGYGGPGQGSQAILGSALVGGGAGGGGAGGGSGSSSNGGGAEGQSRPSHLGESPDRTGSAAGAAAGGTGSAPARKSAGGALPSRQTGAGRKPDGSAGAGKGGDWAATAALASGASTGRAETLGISGGDLLYILLALAGLAFTGSSHAAARSDRRSGAEQLLKG